MQIMQSTKLLYLYVQLNDLLYKKKILNSFGPAHWYKSFREPMIESENLRVRL